MSGLRRYAPMRQSRGTEWPPEVRAEIERLDDHHCVCARAGFPLEVIARCGGDSQVDHVRASHGIGMKSRSTVDNGVVLSAWCHRWKTEHGREARPLLLDWIARRTGDCGHVEPSFGCPGPCNRADPMQMRETA
jgi:hypothetical protein